MLVAMKETSSVYLPVCIVVTLLKQWIHNIFKFLSHLHTDIYAEGSLSTCHSAGVIFIVTWHISYTNDFLTQTSPLGSKVKSWGYKQTQSWCTTMRVVQPCQTHSYVFTIFNLLQQGFPKCGAWAATRGCVRFRYSFLALIYRGASKV